MVTTVAPTPGAPHQPPVDLKSLHSIATSFFFFSFSFFPLWGANNERLEHSKATTYMGEEVTAYAQGKAQVQKRLEKTIHLNLRLILGTDTVYKQTNKPKKKIPVTKNSKPGKGGEYYFQVTILLD